VSVDPLDPTARERYLALGVLLEDMPAHHTIQQTLWNALRCHAMTVSGLTMSSADRQSFHNRESQPTGLGHSNEDAGYDRAWNAARPRVVGEEQEFLPAERRGIGSNLAERKAK
jgi:hypothetical protein